MDSTILLLSFLLLSITSIASLTILNVLNHRTIENLRKQNQHQSDLLTSKDLATYAYISNNTPDTAKPSFEDEPTDDEIGFKEAMQKGYLTRDESIYYGSKQFEVNGVPVLQEQG